VAMFGMASGSKVICFGEAEPLISFEWLRDSAKLAKDRGLKILLRTNGFFKKEPVEEILEYIDAVTIDIKSISNEGYERNCQGGNFEHIKSIIKLIHESGKLLELNFVIHEKLGNGAEEARKLADWIKTELSPSVPLHLARLLPAHRLKELNPTSINLLEEAFNAAKEVGLQFVYLDNVPDHDSNNTYCPNCNELLIQRTSTLTELRRISLTGNCNKCETQLNIVFK
ncbi:MAG: radical SAM protein, partial [Candidatus Heimdallarchaeaceae archaeon]